MRARERVLRHILRVLRAERLRIGEGVHRTGVALDQLTVRVSVAVYRALYKRLIRRRGILFHDHIRHARDRNPDRKLGSAVGKVLNEPLSWVKSGVKAAAGA